MKQRLLCILRFHTPKKSAATFDGEVFHAPCRHCGAPMMKTKLEWVLVDRHAA